MRNRPVLFLLALALTMLILPLAAGADEQGGSVSISLEIVNPTPTPGGGGGGGGGSGAPAVPEVTAGVQEARPVPTAALKAEEPAAPAGELPANPPLPGGAGSLPEQAGPGTPGGTGALGFLVATPAALLVTLLVSLGAVLAYQNRAFLSLYQTWITLYLISMTGLLWAAFVYTQGGPLQDSVFLVTSVIGINLVVHIFRYDRIIIPVPGFAGA